MIEMFPMRALRRDVLIPHICTRGHIVFKKPEETKKCAHCHGFSDDEFREAAAHYNVTHTLGSRVAISYHGIHPLDKADVVNGAVPQNNIPRDGWFLYYMKVTVDGRKLYKIGISQKPFERLKELGPQIIHVEYYDRQEDAYRAEQRLLTAHRDARLNVYVAKLRRKGATEFFMRDVLGLDK